MVIHSYKRCRFRFVGSVFVSWVRTKPYSLFTLRSNKYNGKNFSSIFWYNSKYHRNYLFSQSKRLGDPIGEKRPWYSWTKCNSTFQINTTVMSLKAGNLYYTGLLVSDIAFACEHVRYEHCLRPIQTKCKHQLWRFGISMEPIFNRQC